MEPTANHPKPDQTDMRDKKEVGLFIWGRGEQLLRYQSRSRNQ
jgi:hypothetical protein